MNTLHIKNKQQGMTLIEILIALVLGSFLLAGIYKIFLSSNQNYRMQEGLSRMQESGRFAMEFISRDIRMAGYQGCSTATANNISSPQNPNPNPVPITLPALGNFSLTGNDTVANNWNAIACGVSDDCIAGTDVISYHFGGECGALTGNMATNNANIQISAANSCNIQPYDLLLISDCATSDIFIATSSSSGGGTQTIAHANNQNITPMLGAVYGSDAKIYKINSATFFLRTGANGQPSLWKMDNTKAASGGTNPVELIESIENMQILYGEDTNADSTPDYYVAAGSVVNMNNVVSVRITLTTRTINNRLATIGDGRLRQTYTTTIGVRNRLQ
jgi:type IV pilus assembly protein PilW